MGFNSGFKGLMFHLFTLIDTHTHTQSR